MIKYMLARCFPSSFFLSFFLSSFPSFKNKKTTTHKIMYES